LIRKRKKEAGTATATPYIRNKGDAVTGTTTSDRDHHQGRDVTASHEATLPTATTPITIATTDGQSPGGKRRRRRSGRNRSYETPTSPVVT